MVEKGLLKNKTYTSYRIFHKKFGRDIQAKRHRYSDFETLRNALKAKYCHLGIFIPGLPPKKLVGNAEQSFLLERCQVSFSRAYIRIIV